MNPWLRSTSWKGYSSETGSSVTIRFSARSYTYVRAWISSGMALSLCYASVRMYVRTFASGGFRSRVGSHYNLGSGYQAHNGLMPCNPKYSGHSIVQAVKRCQANSENGLQPYNIRTVGYMYEDWWLYGMSYRTWWQCSIGDLSWHWSVVSKRDPCCWSVTRVYKCVLPFFLIYSEVVEYTLCIRVVG